MSKFPSHLSVQHNKEEIEKYHSIMKLQLLFPVPKRKPENPLKILPQTTENRFQDWVLCSFFSFFLTTGEGCTWALDLGTLPRHEEGLGRAFETSQLQHTSKNKSNISHFGYQTPRPGVQVWMLKFSVFKTSAIIHWSVVFVWKFRIRVGQKYKTKTP